MRTNRRRGHGLLRVTGATAVLMAAGLLVGAALARSNAVPVNVTPPAIGGTPREGQTLTAGNGTWRNSPTSFAYQWRRCDADGTGCGSISGATKKTYTLTAADVDNTIRVIVTASNADGQSSATSAATQVVSSANGPRNTAPPTISGTPKVGEELNATQGTWTGGVRSYAFQWERCSTAGTACVDVTGATGRTYGVRAADVGHTLRVAVTATNAADSATAVSAPTDVVTSGTQPPPPPPPPPPAGNKAPRITLVSARFVGSVLYVRVRICDDTPRNVTIIARDSSPRVASFTHRFATLTPPNPCGAYSRHWRPAIRFRTAHTYTVTLWARDKSGFTSRPVHKTFFR
jgi:hypothetical protein